MPGPCHCKHPHAHGCAVSQQIIHMLLCHPNTAARPRPGPNTHLRALGVGEQVALGVEVGPLLAGGAAEQVEGVGKEGAGEHQAAQLGQEVQTVIHRLAARTGTPGAESQSQGHTAAGFASEQKIRVQAHTVTDRARRGGKALAGCG